MTLRRVEKIIDIDRISKKSNRLSIKSIGNANTDNEQKAQHLVEKFERVGCRDAITSYWFFVKCFQKLSEDTIWRLFERSTEDRSIRSPIKYFIRSCNNLM